jgi:hypothetical protein
VSIHRKRGRPRREEAAASLKKSILVPLPLWDLIQTLAELEGLTTHAWMRQALDDQAKAKLEKAGK